MTTTLPTRRKKATPTTGDAIASQIIPDPNAVAAPPHEDRFEDVPIESLEKPARRASPYPGASTGQGWGYVVETIRAIDPELEYRRLYDALTLGNEATEYGSVLDACNHAEQMRVDAMRLYRHGKLEEESVGRRVNERLEVLRTSAKVELAKEYDESKDEKGKASMKLATIQDISDRMIANWPDEVARLERQKSEIHAAVRLVEELQQAWSSRCATLRVIMERVAPSRPR